MKLIIDIDEDYVKIINKNGANNYPEEVIKNGIPLDDVLDKIEEEIRDIRYGGGLPTALVCAYLKCLEIIDKYKEKRGDKK